MMHTLKISFLAVLIGLVMLFVSCNDQANINRTSAPEIVSGKIPPPVDQNQTAPTEKKIEIAIPAKGIAAPETKDDLQPQIPVKSDEKVEHYDAQGKIDPFLPLLQEKTEAHQSVVDDTPQRILTPLEKIELAQLRLVAVIIMENKKIAMVEESTGKGYEVTIGTFIGKNQGKVTEINDNSIMVTELVKDFKGKFKEQIQEIKLHKNDDEE
jgi:type IV pilus assembly protein PilP